MMELDDRSKCCWGGKTECARGSSVQVSEVKDDGEAKLQRMLEVVGTGVKS